MKRSIALFIGAICGLANVLADNFTITQGTGYVDKESGCVILGNIDGSSITYKTENLPLRDLKCYQTTVHEGIIDSLPISADNYTLSADSQSVTIGKLSTNTGYAITYNNYSYGEPTPINGYTYILQYQPIEKVTFPDTVECDNLRLTLLPVLEYYNVNGSLKQIKREISCGYKAFGMKENGPAIDSATYTTTTAEKFFLEPFPYTDTKFYVTDLIAKKIFNNNQATIVSDSVFKNHAPIAFPTIETTEKQPHEVDESVVNNFQFYTDHKEAIEKAKEFRHSAPLFIDLKSNANEVSNHFVWMFAMDNDAREDVIENGYPYYDSEVNAYEISEPGLHCIQLTVSNLNDTSCVQRSYGCILITESKLAIPNAFTPNGDGINDEFRVAYQSIANFEISIYDQWGRRMYHSEDITQGWDGTFHDDPAAPGTYFYVIHANGTDGEYYSRRGQINLLRSKNKK